MDYMAKLSWISIMNFSILSTKQQYLNFWNSHLTSSSRDAMVEKHSQTQILTQHTLNVATLSPKTNQELKWNEPKYSSNLLHLQGNINMDCKTSFFIQFQFQGDGESLLHQQKPKETIFLELR